MNRKVEDFRRKLANTGFFEETDLSRSENPKKVYQSYKLSYRADECFVS